MIEYPQYKKVLFCTDFSENADYAFDYAYGIAKRDQGLLYLLHIIPEHPNKKFLESMLDSIVLEDARKEYERSLEKDYQDHYLQKAGEEVKIESAYRYGREEDEILKFAKSRQADLIVLGTHGKTGIEHVFFGNVAEKVIRQSPIPVFVIPCKKKPDFPSKVYLYRGRERTFTEAPPKR